MEESNRAYNIIQTAIDLCYPKEVIDRLRRAKTESERIRIMTTARKQLDKEDKK